MRPASENLLAIALLGAIGAGVAGAEPVSPRLYEMATQTGMPHLEENLRYAVAHEQRCLDPRDLSQAFSMLRDVSLQGCRLDKTADGGDAASYRLVCDGSSGTTGQAQWQLGPGRISGTLNVKLGAKNMTFYQRIVATPVGPCPQR